MSYPKHLLSHGCEDRGLSFADDLGLDMFLRTYPSMAIRPSPKASIRVKGKFSFTAFHESCGQLADEFELEIVVPSRFPAELPVVTETAQRIPRRGEFHVNPDGSLCLGSHLRLRIKVSQNRTLSAFVERCLVPYLYAISHKLKNGGPLPFGELAHAGPGLIQDYAELFGLSTSEQVKTALKLLTYKRRIANKKACPCGCKLRLGRCKFGRRLHRFRRYACRSWYKQELSQLS